MKNIETLQGILEARFDQYRQDNRFTPTELYEPVFYTLGNGGKRIRPTLLLMGLNLFSNDIEDGIPPAMAVEIFHNFTLLHDDIMDHSLQRRNKPTVHQKWDINTAILSGDAMMIIAYHFLNKSRTEHLNSLMKVFNKAALEVCEGQQLDMNFENLSSVSEAEYLEMIRLKTSVLLAASLQMGSIIGNADLQDQENIYRFGLNLGMAFQLQDDYLDTYGDQASFGKRIGNDILANKKTFLLVKALEAASGEHKSTLDFWMKADHYTEAEKIKQVTSVYNDLEIPETVKRKISLFHQESLETLKRIKVSDERKKLLSGLAEKLIIRNN